jgi:hypothetical protein
MYVLLSMVNQARGDTPSMVSALEKANDVAGDKNPEIGFNLGSTYATMDPPQIQLGESAALSFEVQGAQNAPVPDIPTADGLAIQYLGPATQVSIVNARVTQ